MAEDRVLPPIAGVAELTYLSGMASPDDAEWDSRRARVWTIMQMEGGPPGTKLALGTIWNTEDALTHIQDVLFAPTLEAGVRPLREDGTPWEVFARPKRRVEVPDREVWCPAPTGYVGRSEVIAVTGVDPSVADRILRDPVKRERYGFGAVELGNGRAYHPAGSDGRDGKKPSGVFGAMAEPRRPGKPSRAAREARSVA
jgi:hypothetical protein